MYVAIQGVIGSGKTTTATLVAQKLGYVSLLEDSDAHPFLADFYRDPVRNGFATEMIFNATHWHDIDQTGNRDVVADYSLGTDLVFARNNLNASQLTAFTASHREYEKLVRPADLSVFLDVDIDAVMERIAQRATVNRPNETGMPREYIEKLRATYLANLHELGQKVVVIPLTGRETPDEVANLVASAVRRERRGIQGSDRGLG